MPVNASCRSAGCPYDPEVRRTLDDIAEMALSAATWRLAQPLCLGSWSFAAAGGSCAALNPANTSTVSGTVVNIMAATEYKTETYSTPCQTLHIMLRSTRLVCSPTHRATRRQIALQSLAGDAIAR